MQRHEELHLGLYWITEAAENGLFELPSRRWNGYSVRVRLRCAIEQPVAIHESETEEIVAPVKSRGKRKPLPANQPRVEALHARPNTHFAER